MEKLTRPRKLPIYTLIYVILDLSKILCEKVTLIWLGYLTWQQDLDYENIC